eukprot:TRINITY_DN1557_c1_g2_i1.p1 TRINITY_DN1557_c1_g2~~TRINITY_DN1557_c1_g2_i1.p1  ORF type:complete len:150 (-),score=41.20 TRINITY_DN1557_c1_g2_i1:252-701(-)
MAHRIVDRKQTYFVLSIIEAKGLRAADSNGKSDPFVVVRINGQKAHKTNVISKNLNPVWQEKLYVGTLKKGASVPLTPDLMKDMLIVVSVWDHDAVTIGTPDFLGVCTLKGDEVQAGFDKWIKLNEDADYKTKTPVTGEIHLRAKFVQK